jgi:hypothetical protein
MESSVSIGCQSTHNVHATLPLLSDDRTGLLYGSLEVGSVRYQSIKDQNSIDINAAPRCQKIATEVAERNRPLNHPHFQVGVVGHHQRSQYLHTVVGGVR